MSNQSKKNGSCLKTGLIAIGALVVIALLASFGWIAGIIWLIFFRKKLNDNPKKQKTATIIVSVLSVLSFIIMIYSFAHPSPQEIAISSDMQGQELELDQDYVIDITLSPANATDTNLKYNVDGMATFEKSTENSKQAILHTMSAGKVTVSVSNGEVKSNSLEFNIIDTDKIETIETEFTETESQEENTPITLEDAKKALESLLDSLINSSYKTSSSYSCDLLTDAELKDHVILSIGLESSDFTNETSCINAITPIISGLLNNEYYSFISSMNFEMISNGQITYTIHVDDATAITSEDDIASHLDVQPLQTDAGADSNISETNGDTPSSSDAANVPDVSLDADMVWIDNTGKKYHSKSTCSNMDAPYQVTREEAEAMGRGPCKRCYR